MALEVVKQLSQWSFQNKHIERDMDNSAMAAAHPDDTLVLAGPPRKTAVVENDLLPIGMLQQISFQQNKNTQPLMSIGGGRAFFASGKAQTSWSAARMFVNGRSFLRVLHNNAIVKKLNVVTLDDKAGAVVGPGADAIESRAPKYVANLDSELFYVPFGMACLFRNKQRELCGSFYMESCMIVSWNTAIGAGSSQIMENVSGVADRLLPYKVTNTPHPQLATLDGIVGFTG